MNQDIPCISRKDIHLPEVGRETIPLIHILVLIHKSTESETGALAQGRGCVEEDPEVSLLSGYLSVPRENLCTDGPSAGLYHLSATDLSPEMHPFQEAGPLPEPKDPFLEVEDRFPDVEDPFPGIGSQYLGAGDPFLEARDQFLE